MDAVKHRWPKALIQFGKEANAVLVSMDCVQQKLSILPGRLSPATEDFSSDSASKLLSIFRTTHLCFNDDIQGTGATTLAGKPALHTLCCRSCSRWRVASH